MNQYRCGTCNIEPCYFHPSNEEWRRNMNGGNDSSPIPISLFTIRFGCASHSDFNPQAEWEKVLEEVRTRLSKLKTAYPRGTGADFVWWLVIDTALNELRQGKDGE